MKDSVTNIPAQFESASPASWAVTPDTIVGLAGPITDLFVDPFGNKRILNAPSLVFPVAGDFLLQAEVTVEFASKFDAGVLLLWQDEQHWAKLCFEFSPQSQPMIVSVVNREFSDDCNSITMPSNRVHLRVGMRGAGCVFHYSEDGNYWHMVRVFRLAHDKPMKAGFLVQSPTGNGTRVEFTNIRYAEKTLPDTRSGE